MVPLTRQEATARFKDSWTKVDISKAKAKVGGGSSPDPIAAHVRQEVLDCLTATQDLVDSYHQHMLQKVHDEEMLSSDDAQELAATLAQVTKKFFPGPGCTLVDDANSLEARVTRLTPAKLNGFRSALSDTGYEAVILVDWFDWFRREITHDPGGMFAAIRHQHDLTRVFRDRLGALAAAFSRLRDEAT